MVRRARAEVEADRCEAEKLAAAQPAPPCSVAGCGQPTFLPCHACGANLCADHARTRLLVTHCPACASSEVDVSSTFSSLPTLRHATVTMSPTGERLVDVDNAEDGTMATKKAAKKVAAKAAKAGTKLESKWGRVGSASELYKRVIMEDKLSNKDAYARVAKELGQKAAGKPTYAGWYRAKLKADGVKGVPVSK